MTDGDKHWLGGVLARLEGDSQHFGGVCPELKGVAAVMKFFDLMLVSVVSLQTEILHLKWTQSVRTTKSETVHMLLTWKRFLATPTVGMSAMTPMWHAKPNLEGCRTPLPSTSITFFEMRVAR